MTQEKVAVFSPFSSDVAAWKSYALFFDRIYIEERAFRLYLFSIVGSTENYEDQSKVFVGQKARDDAKSEQVINEINYLLDYGFLNVFDGHVGIHESLERTGPEYLEIASKLAAEHGDTSISIPIPREYACSYLDVLSRVTAANMRLKGIDAVYLDSTDGKNVDRKAGKDQLFEIILDDLHIPHETVPWADVFDFRSDPTSQQQLRALRLWIADMSKGNLTYSEAVDKVEYLKDEYRSHMKGAGIKTANAFIKALVVGGAEVIENALKFRLKNLAETSFKLLEAKGDLLEAERNAPGRELAYVIRAVDSFKHP
jgi:hypothetical protein